MGICFVNIGFAIYDCNNLLVTKICYVVITLWILLMSVDSSKSIQLGLKASGWDEVSKKYAIMLICRMKWIWILIAPHFFWSIMYNIEEFEILRSTLYTRSLVLIETVIVMSFNMGIMAVDRYKEVPIFCEGCIKLPCFWDKCC